ncbi:hypothetical protein IMSHALPRED_006105 [Imshaugia aleurites]|uniref:Ribonuclease n=1 Tax=Imshaugia aleurites TaxID=172621 RepID=A0A8H3FGK9_9LECA|nr:hypothetical protein IMSHALPRED_006105 [Imshaugia aleurites]
MDMGESDSQDIASQDIAQESPAQHVFIAPSLDQEAILAGASYTHHSAIPEIVTENSSTECVLGVDEAGRGPVLGPMVYALLYVPLTQHRSLLAQTHRFDDSKVLTPTFRSSLMKTLCTPGTDLFQHCGWATRVMSARDIGSAMLRPAGTYNLNAQAMDATIDLIKDVFAKGINVREIYIDTIGSPAVYQKKLERIFPTTMITVAKKADSLYPCVSAASVCAKVTRDAALEVCYQTYASVADAQEEPQTAAEGWGSGYPSDARCTTWLKEHVDPLFGWGSECRFSWGTAKDLLEAKGTRVDWPVEDDDEQGMRVTDFFSARPDGETEKETNELTTWFGRPVAEEVF